MIDGQKIFITGGAGWIGSKIIEKYYKNNEIVVYSRDEAKHYFLKKRFPNVKFILGDVYMPPVEEGQIVYEVWNNIVESEIKEGTIRAVDVFDRTLTYFDCNTFHTGQKALKSGWRWFGRISRNTDRVKNITNEIRVNAQVYLEFPTKGW